MKSLQLKKGFLIAAAMAGVVFLNAEVSHAIPSLQLDIKGGTYDKFTETTVSKSKAFTLYAYLIPDSSAPLADWYYISAAIGPKFGPGKGNLGSFEFDSKEIKATDDMVYGNPPVDTVYAGQGHDPGDLSSHDIFDTYFHEFRFKFDEHKTRTAYNTQTGEPGKGSMYYQEFSVDTSALKNPYMIHFDLYNTVTNNVIVRVPQTVKDCKKTGKKTVCTDSTVMVDRIAGTDTDIRSFAPYSHDAESCRNCSVPEPSTLILLGSGITGLAAIRIFRKKG